MGFTGLHVRDYASSPSISTNMPDGLAQSSKLPRTFKFYGSACFLVLSSNNIWFFSRQILLTTYFGQGLLTTKMKGEKLTLWVLLSPALQSGKIAQQRVCLANMRPQVWTPNSIYKKPSVISHSFFPALGDWRQQGWWSPLDSDPGLFGKL